MADVFISTGTKIADDGEALADSLEKHGISAWVDRRLQPGEYWGPRIEQALGEAKTFVVLIGPEEEPDRRVRREWSGILRQAWSKPAGKKLIPVLLHGARLPPFLSHWNAVRSPAGPAEITEELAAVLRGDQEPAPNPEVEAYRRQAVERIEEIRRAVRESAELEIEQ